MGPFISVQYPEGTRVQINTVDNLHLIGVIKGYRFEDDKVTGVFLELEHNSEVILVTRGEITSIFDV